MTPEEFWWFAEWKMDIRMYGSLTEDDCEDLYQLMKNHGVIDGDSNR
jgi:hypothetical protein